MTTKTVGVTENVISKPEVLADDDRGVIEQLDNTNEGNSVLRITSKAGTVRANHYHQKDHHVCYLVSGQIRYVERPVGKDGVVDESIPLTEYTIKPGQLFYTAPMVAHAMEFTEDSEFLAITPRGGGEAEYENDVIRVTLIEPEEAAARAAKK
ncbi:hypothetical protein CL628_01775 [bacterium]|nr:hypothetical protein [bacterium]